MRINLLYHENLGLARSSCQTLSPLARRDKFQGAYKLCILKFYRKGKIQKESSSLRNESSFIFFVFREEY